MPGTLSAGAVRQGKPRERFGLCQRRIRPRVFGEPQFEVELVPTDVHEERPHVIAHDAWQHMFRAAEADGIETRWLEIHSAYRSVAFQQQIFEYWLDKRRQDRRAAGEPDLSEAELRRIQRKWTAEPGTSAHHTGFALDLKLYELRAKAKHSPVYEWLAGHAATFGFYPYIPEGWHWEYNPPGLVDQVRELRRRIEAGEPFEQLLRSPLAHRSQTTRVQ